MSARVRVALTGSAQRFLRDRLERLDRLDERPRVDRDFDFVSPFFRRVLFTMRAATCFWRPLYRPPRLMEASTFLY